MIKLIDKIFGRLILLILASVLIVFAYQYLIIFFGACVFANYISSFTSKLSSKFKLSDFWVKLGFWLCFLGVIFGSLFLFGATLVSEFSSYAKELVEVGSSVASRVKDMDLLSGYDLSDFNFSGVFSGFLGSLYSFVNLILFVLLLMLLSFFMSFELKDMRVYLKRISEKSFIGDYNLVKKVESSGEIMNKWLTDRLLSMLVVSVLIFIGLIFVDVDFRLALAITAGVLSFIPNLGPILALVPAVLLSLSSGIDTVLIVLAIYFVVQIIESNFITPFIFKSDLKIPISLTFLFQFIFGAFFGSLGLVFAVPMGLFIMSLVGVDDSNGG